MKKVIGIILIIMDVTFVLLSILLYVSTRKYHPAGTGPEFGLYILVSIFLLFFLFGISFVLSDQINVLLERKKQKKSEHRNKINKIYEKQRKSELAKKEVKCWKENLTKSCRVPEYRWDISSYDQAQAEREVTVFRNQGIQKITKIKVSIGILLWGGAIASIPIVSSIINLKPAYIGIYAVAATFLFWFGVIVWGCAVGEQQMQRLTGFAVTNLWEVYYININREIYKDHPGIPLNKTAQLIKTMKKAQYVAQKEEQQQQYLYSSQVDTFVKERINQVENQETIMDDLMVITKIYCPEIHRKLFGKIEIDYWNETSGKKESAVLFPTNKGFDRIARILQKRENRERTIYQ